MVTSWIIAICSIIGLISTAGIAVYKFRVKVREDQTERERLQREAASAQAEEALRIARDETRTERQKYEEMLLRQIHQLQEDVENEQSAREVLQRRYEELLTKERGAAT